MSIDQIVPMGKGIRYSENSDKANSADAKGIALAGLIAGLIVLGAYLVYPSGVPRVTYLIAAAAFGVCWRVLGPLIFLSHKLSK